MSYNRVQFFFLIYGIESGPAFSKRQLKENFLSLIKEKIRDPFFLFVFIRYFLDEIIDGV